MKKLLLLLVTLTLASTSHAYYQAEQGRWVNRDPAQEMGGRNVYEFVLDNPIGFIDVHGLMAQPPSSAPEEVDPSGGGIIQTPTVGDGGSHTTTGNTPAVTRIPGPTSDCSPGNTKDVGSAYDCAECCPKKCQKVNTCEKYEIEITNGNRNSVTHTWYSWSSSTTITCK